MNWKVVWYFERFDCEVGEPMIGRKVLKLCDKYEEAYSTMIDLIRGPYCGGFYRVEENI